MVVEKKNELLKERLKNELLKGMLKK